MEVLFQFSESTFVSMATLALFVYLMVEYGVKPTLAIWGIEKTDDGEDKRYKPLVFISALAIGVVASFLGLAIVGTEVVGMGEIAFAFSRGLVAGLGAVAGYQGLKIGKEFFSG